MMVEGLSDESELQTEGIPALTKQLREGIVKELGSDSPLISLVRLIEESDTRRRSVLLLVNDSIGQLRLDMKYLVFDLEATRRERDLYEKQRDRYELERDQYLSLLREVDKIRDWEGEMGSNEDSNPNDKPEPGNGP